MKHLAILSIILLAGCIAKFNQLNYNRMVDVVVLSRDQDSVCNDRNTTSTTLDSIHKNTIYALEDAKIRKDDDIAKMLTNQLDEIDRFQTILSKEDIGKYFCKQKIRNIYDTATLIASEEWKKSSAP